MSGAAGHTEGGETARRALRLLEAVARGPEPLGLAQLTTELGTSRSVTYRLLRVLQEEGFLDRAPGGGYRVGARTLGLSVAVLPEGDSAARAGPLLAALAMKTSETVAMHQRLGERVVLLAGAESRQHQLSRITQIGEVTPLGWGASELVQLAVLSDGEARRLLATTPYGDAELHELIGVIRAVRDSGWAYSEGVNHPGIAGVAAPVPSTALRQTSLSISVSGPTIRMTREVAEGYLPALLDTCAEVGALLARDSRPDGRSWDAE